MACKSINKFNNNMKITSKLRLTLKSILSLKFGEIATDKATLTWDGEGELAEGVEVFVKDENEEIVPAADGEYTTEDGKVITVAEGKVASIKEKEAEKEEPEAEENKENEVEVLESESEAEPVDAPKPEEIEEPKVEDRIAALEVEIGEVKSVLEQILNAVVALEGRLDAVEEKVAKVESEPSTNPVEEPVVEDTKMSRLAYLRKK